MKKKYLWLFIATLTLLSGCSTSPYSYADNWVLRQNSKPLYYAHYDILYFYPEGIIQDDAQKVSWALDRLNAEKIYDFTRFQTSEIFGNRVRIFAPFIHRTSMEEFHMNVNESITYYLDHFYQKNRPFVIIAEKTGAAAVYNELLNNKKLSPEKGLIAVVLLDMPGGIPLSLNSTLTSRGLSLAFDDKTPGAIFGWSIGNAPEKAQGYGINPLSWKTDNEKVEAEKNQGAVFLNSDSKKTEEKREEVLNFCGAQLQGESGYITLIVPEKFKKYLAKSHIKSNLSPFAYNTRNNIEKRVREYRYILQWEKR